jgi:hypothetical protein
VAAPDGLHPRLLLQVDAAMLQPKADARKRLQAPDVLVEAEDHP